MTQRPNKEQLGEMKKENLRWSKTLTPINPSEWPLSINAGQIPGDQLVNVFRSREFLVQIFKQQGIYLRLSIQSTDYDPRRKRFKDGLTWDQLMQLKTETGYGDYCALELYPPNHLVVNVANIRHLFLYPKDQFPPFLWMDNVSSPQT